MPNKPKPTSTSAWHQAILEYIADHPDRPLKAKALARELHVANEQYAAFREELREMLAGGALVLGPGRCLELPDLRGVVTGVFRATRRGFGFLQIPNRPDIFVPADRTGDALDGDTVAARIIGGKKRGAEMTAEVTRILERAVVRWVGVLEQRGRQWIVRPRGRTPAPVVTIDDPTAKAARPGDMVVVEPLQHTLTAETARGVIVERLGPPSETQTKILSVIRCYGIPDRFPDEVSQAAHEALSRLEQHDSPDREDLRKLLTITIDPPDARDFDDAISIETLEGGAMRLGVHIADVAHFVERDAPLDREARARGNSVYFPSFVVPMLPEVLSNGVCSLQPEQPRLTKSAFLTYNERGEVTATRFANSIIRSHARLTYDQVTEILGGKHESVTVAVRDLLLRAERLARSIRERRLTHGMVVLTLPEVEIKLGPEGKVIDAGPADTSFSHTLIEMFMVEANEAVCRMLAREGIPHLRRIHPPPEPEAVNALGQLAAAVGRKPPKKLDRPTILGLLSAVHGKPEETAVNYVLLRSLAQATYSPSHEGHFALASEHYCHFTSPIRRYADLTIHRLLDLYVRGALRPQRRGKQGRIDTIEELTELGRHISATERRAQASERDLKSLLLLDLMRGKLGQTLPGIVTGVTSFGAFVQVQPYMAEGLVRVPEMESDRWVFSERTGTLHGQRSGRMIALGQRVQVIVSSIDETRQELALVPAVGFRMGVVASMPSAPEGSQPRRHKGPGKRPSRHGGRNRR